MKCEMRWVNSNGEPTPDSNNSVMLAHFHETVWLYPNGCVNNRIVGYSKKIVESFPICADHYARVTADMRYENGGAWSFTTSEAR